MLRKGVEPLRLTPRGFKPPMSTFPSPEQNLVFEVGFEPTHLSILASKARVSTRFHHSNFWRIKRDSNPRSLFTRNLFSRQAVSATHTLIHWYSERDLNPYPLREGVLSPPCMPFHHLSIKKRESLSTFPFPFEKKLGHYKIAASSILEATKNA